MLVVDYIVAGTYGFYEVLLIVLVLILIYNGFLRSKILGKVDRELSKNQSLTKTSDHSELKAKKIDVEYVDYEIVNDKTD